MTDMGTTLTATASDAIAALGERGKGVGVLLVPVDLEELRS